MKALEVLYQRPSPAGPAPVERKTPRAIMAEGKGPIFSQLPGVPAYASKYPPELLEAQGGKDLFSNDNNVELTEGTVRFVSFDRTVNDSKLSKDSMAFDASFTDHEGAKWRIVQTRLATVSPDPVNDPWYGGLAIDTLLHGDTHRSEPGEPKTMCAMCSWGWADIWKNGAKVTSSALLHVMLSSDAHDEKNGFKYIGYDVTDQPVREVHIVVKPGSDVPAPGGYLHVMFENSVVTRGTPEEIVAKAPKLQPDIPTVTLNAVPHLQWGATEIKLEAGKPVRLILNNLDPASFHVFLSRTSGGPVQVPLPQGEQWTTTVVFDQPGEYEYWCPISNHRNRGMYGRFIVTESVPGGTEGPPGGKK